MYLTPEAGSGSYLLVVSNKAKKGLKMELVLYKTQDGGYYYVVEIGGPTDTVRFGEGETPAKAASSLEGTQYQSADFSCRAPAYSKLHRWFTEVCPDTVLVACTCDEESEAEAAVFE